MAITAVKGMSERSRLLRGPAQPRPTPHNLQFFRFEDLLNLRTRVVRPCPHRVHADVSAPVRKRFAWFSQAFESEREIVMSVSVVGSDGDGRTISIDGFIEPSSFVQHITEVEKAQRVSRVDLHRLTIVAFGLPIVLLVVVDRSQIDTRRSVPGIDLEHAPV